jgi:hypothetical protein
MKKKKKNNSTYRRKTYKNRKRNTYKKRKNKTKRRRRNMKGGISLRERATTKVNNMRKRGSELWEKHGDTIKKGVKDAAAVVGTGLSTAHLLKNNQTYKEIRDQHRVDRKRRKLEKEKANTATQVPAPVVPAPVVPAPVVPAVKTEEERGREAYAAYDAEVERSVKLHDELILLGDDALWWRANADGVDKDKIASAHTSSGKVKRATMVDLIMSLPPSKWTGAGAP